MLNHVLDHMIIALVTTALQLLGWNYTSDLASVQRFFLEEF